MKSKVLLTTLGLGLGLIALSSYQNGPAHGGAGNRTGSNGSLGCSTAGCHMGDNANLALSFQIVDDAGGVTVTDGKYTPGHTYTIAFKGVYSGAATYTHLGFQASAVNAANANSGTIAKDPAVTNSATADANGITVVEHTAPLPKTGNDFITTFKWTAPAAGSGTAKIYARMMANNHNGIPGDDTPNQIIATLTEKATTGINDVAKSNLFKIYPNPAQNTLRVQLDKLTSGSYDIRITSIDGKSMLTTKSNFNGGEMNMDISNLANGVYSLTIQNKDANQTLQFVKK
jgi:hypothetical protein